MPCRAKAKSALLWEWTTISVSRCGPLNFKQRWNARNWHKTNLIGQPFPATGEIPDRTRMSLSELIGITFSELYGISRLRRRSFTRGEPKRSATHVCQISLKEFGQ